MINKEVVQSFTEGLNAKTNNLTSIDGKLYSYDLLIGINKLDKYGIKKIIILDYNIKLIEKLTGYKSITSRQHLGILNRVLTNPEELVFNITSTEELEKYYYNRKALEERFSIIF
jgi:hypothetical protein